MESREVVEANRAAWNLTAGAYAADVEADIQRLQLGVLSLFDHELRLLGKLSPWCGRAIHLQCSHGQDALSLWKLGAREVVGVDLSEAMLALAQRKSDALQAPATWVHSDILSTPEALNASADLVYTGKGALPWMMDLAAWARVVTRLLKPGGLLYVFEGHPLDWVWEPDAREYRLRRDGSGYFSEAPRVNDTFPASYLQRATEAGEAAPLARERQWTLGDVLNAVIGAGLRIERLEERPEPFWRLLTNLPEKQVEKLPHTFSLLARK